MAQVSESSSSRKGKKKRKGIQLNLYAQTGSHFMDDIEKAVKDEDDPDAIVNKLAEKEDKTQAKEPVKEESNKEEKKSDDKKAASKEGAKESEKSAEKQPQKVARAPPSHSGPTVSIDLKNNNNE